MAPTRSRSAPPSMRPGVAPTGGIPSRSARFRRGSRGPRVTPPDIPKIGVVEVDPNFKPRIELLPPKQPDIEPRTADATPSGSPSGGDERRERGERGGRGGRGGRGRRGGRGGGGRGRGAGAGAGAANGGERGLPRDNESPRASLPEPAAPPLPPPAPTLPASEPDEQGDGGESFWSKVKRGLTGGP